MNALADSLQYIVNTMVGYMDAVNLQALIDYFVDCEADEGEYTDTFRVLDHALNDWIMHSTGASPLYLEQASRLKKLLTMTRDERGEAWQKGHRYRRFNHSSMGCWKSEDYMFIPHDDPGYRFRPGRWVPTGFHGESAVLINEEEE